MTWVTGTVVAGHGVASGREKADRFPGGAIALQRPHFAARGLDLSEFWDGTINVDVSPRRAVLVCPEWTFPMVEWLPGYPAETFSFARMRIRAGGAEYPAMLFLPHPETKPEHHQAPGVLEVMAPWIDGMSTAHAVEVWLDPERFAVTG